MPLDKSLLQNILESDSALGLYGDWIEIVCLLLPIAFFTGLIVFVCSWLDWEGEGLCIFTAVIGSFNSFWVMKNVYYCLRPGVKLRKLVEIDFLPESEDENLFLTPLIKEGFLYII